MSAQFKRLNIVVYSFVLIVISSLMTVLYYHVFIFKTFSNDDGQLPALRELSADQVLNSPIKDNHSIIEVMSYGCHYCAENEDNIVKFSKMLPPDTFKAIHITNRINPLAAYAPIFATFAEMGVEDKMRNRAYIAILMQNIDLTNENKIEAWLAENNIDVKKYKIVRGSNAVKARLDNMAAITQFYNINATPVFIINKRYMVVQDRAFPEFAQHMRQLLNEGK